MHYLAVSVGQQPAVPFVDVTFLTDGTMSEQKYAWISEKIAQTHSVHCQILHKILRVTFDKHNLSTMGNVVFGVLYAYARVHALRYSIRDWNNEPINQGYFKRWNFDVGHCESIEETLASCVTKIGAIHLVGMACHCASCNVS
jgi:hypothetical protein